MLSVAEAQVLIMQHARPLPAVVLPLADAAPGQVLAEDVVSDLDMPPHDKSMMDGYAIRSTDLTEGKATLTVIEEVTAGRVPGKKINPGQATRIMTGAPIPAGADAVVQVERTRLAENNRVLLEDRPSPGQHILPKGREMRRGDVVLSAGTILRPQVFGLLATVGRTQIKVHPAPRVAVLSTGDELVDAEQTPGPGQIRNSNGPMLVAQIARAGASPHNLGIARDDRESLHKKIAEGLRQPVLILSGGVSAGKLDLVPGVLQELGMEAHFHKVEMKPGKPVFFGSRNPSDSAACLVFGLPGNPVSSLVCFELFVRPALRRLMGHTDAGPRMVPVPLAEDFAYKTDRPTYYPARLEMDEAGCRVRPGPWFGSADLRALANTNAFILFPAGDHQHRAGQAYRCLMCEGEPGA